MAKRSNNSLGRRSYGGKPYDANNSFVKKMATKVTDLIPQRSWISKWFNANQDDGDETNQDVNSIDAEEEIRQPPMKRPRIRMDVTHPPGTFSIRARDKNSVENHNSQIADETEEYFAEPAVAGPSGTCKFVSSESRIDTETSNSNSQRSRQTSRVPTSNNGVSNGIDDNSESGESTSGCSSLVPRTNRQESVTNSAYDSNLTAGRNRFVDDKSSFANHAQSPRCLFLESAISGESSSRRPSFNASILSNNGNNIERSSSLSSPFYSGNVRFGGSNAIGNYKRGGRSLFNSSNEFQLKIPRRTNVRVKPSTNVESIDSSGMSQTAKRILEAMEYFSSPISDAKKIPVKKLSETPSSSSLGRKRLRDEESSSISGTSLSSTRVGLRHLTRELAVPTVPEMLKLRRRQRLQDTTLAARKIISAMSGPPVSSSSWSTASTSSTVSSIPVTSLASQVNEDYRLRTELDEIPKYHGKLRGKSKKNPEDEGPAPSVNLPSISLAITSLPSFEPLPKYTVPPINFGTREKDTKETDDLNGYKFASPIKITEASWNLKSINNFSFSKPINANESTESHRQDKNSIITSRIIDSVVSTPIIDGTASLNFMRSGSSTAPRLKVKNKRNDKASDEKTFIFGENNVNKMEITKLKSNDGATSVDSDIKKSITNENTLNLEIWECSECYIKNDSSENSCVACKTSKPRQTGNEETTELSSPMANDNDAKSKISIRNSTNPADVGFGKQFKMSVNQWECESCLVRNQMTSSKCVSCSSPKPNSGTNVNKTEDSITGSSVISAKQNPVEKFKPAKGSWECPGCMLINPSSVITCPCCSASKPSLAKGSTKKINSDKTGTSGESWKNNEIENTSKLMDKFKPAASSWECSSCLVRNNETASVCVCCSNPKSSGFATGQLKDSSPRVNVESGWGDKFKKPEGSWSCESCMLQNKSEANECVACNTTKPGGQKKSGSPITTTTTTTTSQFSFGIPATDGGNFKFGMDKANVKPKWSSGTELTNGFGFGVDAARTKLSDPGQFTFGIPKETEKVATNPTSGFVFASPKNSNDKEPPKFDTSKNGNEISIESGKSSNDVKNDSTTFVFGMPKSSNKRPAETSLEDSTNNESDANAKINNGKSPFVFGVPKTDEKITIFGNQSRTTMSNESNTGNGEEDQRGKSSSSSVTSPGTDNSAQARTPFTFSEPKSKITSQTSTSITPSFGQTTVPSSTSTFSTDTTENPNKSLITSNFGIPNSINPSAGFGVVSSSGTSSILTDATPIDTKNCFAASNDKPKSTTFFGIPEDKKSSTFDTTMEKKSLIFGNSNNNNLTTGGFGSNDKPITGNTMFNSSSSSTTSSTAPGFGINPAVTSQPVFGSSTNQVFGGNTTTPSFSTGNNATTTSIFASVGKSNVTTAPATNPSLFSFGGAANPQKSNLEVQYPTFPRPGQFNLGPFSNANETADSAGSANKTIFPFGKNEPGKLQINTGECFGTGGTNTGTFGAPTAPTTNQTSSPFTFNAPATKQDPPSAFGQNSGTIPNMFGTQPVLSGIGQQGQTSSTFATNPAAPTTGFSFGATTPSTISGGFNFGGAMTQPAASPSGFNFNAPSATPAVAFDPNTRPSFNFTSGTAPTAFNATPQPVGTRKIKKAVRRMQQHR